MSEDFVGKLRWKRVLAWAPCDGFFDDGRARLLQQLGPDGEWYYVDVDEELDPKAVAECGKPTNALAISGKMTDIGEISIKLEFDKRGNLKSGPFPVDGMWTFVGTYFAIGTWWAHFKKDE